jgi:hypothetical protein
MGVFGGALPARHPNTSLIPAKPEESERLYNQCEFGIRFFVEYFRVLRTLKYSTNPT